MKFKLWCLFVVLANPCLGQSPIHVWSMFVILNKLVYEIVPHLKNPGLLEKAARTVDALEKFKPLINDPDGWRGSAFAEGYLSQLNEDQIVLNAALRLIWGNKDIDSYYSLGDALDDFYLKVNACLLNGGKAVGAVSVNVHTKHSGIEVSNWRVVCMAKILQLYSNHYTTAFPRLSSPTQWELAPGRYIMWAEDPETGNTSSKQEIPIDRNQECDLVVP
jgi:hypothetical protein